ncbi:DUF2017 family protein [Georgenia sp.]
MRAFVAGSVGYVSRLESAERAVIARLVADTAELLGTRFAAAETGNPGYGIDPGDVDPAHTASDRIGDDAVLAALDFAPAEPTPRTVPADPALARLLPPMSRDDDALAGELRDLTEQTLRAGKIAGLRTVWQELEGPSGPDGAVAVRRGQESPWLAAMTDVRLVLASRLGIESDADAEAVYERAQQPNRMRRQGPDDERDEVENALATMYAALTWWQESLLEAVRRRGRGR